MPSPSDREAHLIADLVRESERIETFLEGIDEAAFASNEEKVHAVQKALQNLCEACIQIDGKRDANRFAVLFPKHQLADIETVGDRLRHDYGAMDPMLVWTQVARLVPAIKADAETRLHRLRRLHGGAD